MEEAGYIPRPLILIIEFVSMSTEASLPKITLDRGAVSVILWNLTPLIGCLFFGWQPISIFICYALETIVIGLFNVLKLVVVYNKGLPPKPTETGVSGLGIIPFFLVHYFFFVFVQLGVFFGISGSLFMAPFKAITDFMDTRSTFIALAIYIANCAALFVNDFIATGVYKRRTMAEQMFEPYLRIIIQQFVVILGSMVFQVTGSGWPVLIIFIGIKMYLDLLVRSRDFVDWIKEQQEKAEEKNREDTT